jgi:hypothetical protein
MRRVRPRGLGHETETMGLDVGFWNLEGSGIETYDWNLIFSVKPLQNRRQIFTSSVLKSDVTYPFLPNLEKMIFDVADEGQNDAMLLGRM